MWKQDPAQDQDPDPTIESNIHHTMVARPNAFRSIALHVLFYLALGNKFECFRCPGTPLSTNPSQYAGFQDFGARPRGGPTGRETV